MLGTAAQRFLLMAALLVAAYFATAPLFYESAFVDVVAGWIAATGGAILAASGTTVALSGAIIRTTHGAFIVTQECIFTPLIPLYGAAALAAPMGWRRRTAMLVATPAVFFALGVSRLLVLAVPAAVIGSYSVAIHAFSQTLVAVLLVALGALWTADGGRRGAARAAVAVALGAVAAFAAAPVLGAVVGGAVGGLQSLAGHAGHAFADNQGAWAILPAFQVGLFAALWLAVAGRWPLVAARVGRARRRGAGAGALRRPGGRARPPLRLRSPRGPAPRLGARAPRGGGVVARAPGAVRGPRHAGPAARPSAGRLGLPDTARAVGADGLRAAAPRRQLE